MSYIVQQIRSTEEGKRPRAEQLAEGQLAVNVNNASPGVFLRTTTDKVVKVGGTAVGPTSPFAVYNNEYSVGELWYDTSVGELKVYDGNTFVNATPYTAGDATTLASANSHTDTEVAGIVGTAPDALNTLGKIATALNNDASFYNTTQASLDLKANAADAVLTGTPSAPTAPSGTSTTQVATTEFVTTALDALLGAAPGALDTLNELAAALSDDPNFATTITTAISDETARVDALIASDMWLFANQAVFPVAAHNHGRVVHSHADGAMFYSHGGSWIQLTTQSALDAVQLDVDTNESDADAAILELNGNVNDLITLSGVAENATDLGTFTGDIITDNVTVKTALQELETRAMHDAHVHLSVHNDSGVGLVLGYAVYVSGTHANGKPTVAKADANGADTYPAVGIVAEAIADGGEGEITISGLVEGLDTDSPAWDAGTALYLDTTAGELTSTRPTAAGTKVQKVALVARRHVNAGSIIVMGAGRTNDVPNELTTLTGVALNDTDLGTFTGVTITDNVDIKAALQELETAVEGGTAPLASNFTFDASLIPDTDSVYDIGSATFRVRDLYLSDNSLNFASGTLEIVGGKLRFDGDDVAKDSELAEIDVNVNDILTALGVAENTATMGTFVNSVLTDGVTLKTVLEDFADEYNTRKTTVDNALATKLDSAGAQAALSVDHLITLSGVAEAADDLGTFTGTTITDSSDIKTALQELETAVEANASATTELSNDTTPQLGGDLDLNGSDIVTGANKITYASSGLGSQFYLAQTQFGVTNVGTLASVKSFHLYLDANSGDTGQAFRIYNDVHPDNLGATVIGDYVFQVADTGAVNCTGTLTAPSITLGSTAITATGDELNYTGDLGTFTGVTITDNSDIKTALQELETSLELKANFLTLSEVDLNVDDLVTLSGVAENDTNLGAFTGTTLSDTSTIKAALQALETAVEGVGSGSGDSLSDLRSYVGGSAGDTHLGTMIGNVVTNNVSVKTALNELVIRIEDHEDGTTNFTGFQLAGTAVTATGAELNILDGATLDVTELNYVDGVTSAIQTQLDAKAPLASPALTGTPTAPTAAVNTNTTQLATTAFVVAEVSNELSDTANAASMRTALGITENAGDPADGRGMYYDTSASKYLLSS